MERGEGTSAAKRPRGEKRGESKGGERRTARRGAGKSRPRGGPAEKEAGTKPEKERGKGEAAEGAWPQAPWPRGEGGVWPRLPAGPVLLAGGALGQRPPLSSLPPLFRSGRSGLRPRGTSPRLLGGTRRLDGAHRMHVLVSSRNKQANGARRGAKATCQGGRGQGCPWCHPDRQAGSTRWVQKLPLRGRTTRSRTQEAQRKHLAMHAHSRSAHAPKRNTLAGPARRREGSSAHAQTATRAPRPSPPSPPPPPDGVVTSASPGRPREAPARMNSLYAPPSRIITHPPPTAPPTHRLSPLLSLGGGGRGRSRGRGRRRGEWKRKRVVSPPLRLLASSQHRSPPDSVTSHPAPPRPRSPLTTRSAPARRERSRWLSPANHRSRWLSRMVDATRGPPARVPVRRPGGIWRCDRPFKSPLPVCPGASLARPRPGRSPPRHARVTAPSPHPPAHPSHHPQATSPHRAHATESRGTTGVEDAPRHPTRHASMVGLKAQSAPENDARCNRTALGIGRKTRARRDRGRGSPARSAVAGNALRGRHAGRSRDAVYPPDLLV